ncbi:methyltransferase, FkbM family [Verrucomicrobium sp. GAS474]|uniref:FkbM family methyltransferase n=1 Tax=Verrucomicrobium sp. GAS474 TaxID=1882831 RepID=UPI00087B1220|nr:FkbM family methyltransferase [Verrucomicrobium sp. GAS474]SDT86105.1 methyltransferase, FkbM family [Verrucomicrobium sp. GAS474]
MIGKLRHLVRLLRRRREARRWGVPFARVRDFSLPDRLVIDAGGKAMPLSFPPGPEVVTAFVALLLDDEYGLTAIPEGTGTPVRTILDIGGNVGLFSVAARRRFPSALIHVYEPNAALLLHLRVQAAGIGAAVFPEAAGARDGEITFFPTSDSMTGTVEPTSENGTGVTVPQTSLASALDRLAGPGGTVDLVKMDCEGAEWAMLEDRASLSRIGRLLLEYHPRSIAGVECDPAALPALLAAGGLRIERQIATAGGCGVIWASRNGKEGGAPR